MRRICKACEREYDYEPATARVGKHFFITCSASCLCELVRPLAGAEARVASQWNALHPGKQFFASAAG